MKKHEPLFRRSSQFSYLYFKRGLGLKLSQCKVPEILWRVRRERLKFLFLNQGVLRNTLENEDYL